MGRTRATARRGKPRPVPSDDGAKADSLAALVNFVRSLPADDGDEEQEPPSKRVKTSASGSAICIARQDLKLPRGETSLAPETATFTRQNVGDAISLHLGREDKTKKTSAFEIYSRVKRDVPGFVTQFMMPTRHLSTEVVAAVRVAKDQRVNPGPEGCIWASIDISVEQSGTSAQVSLRIQVWWNENLGVWAIPQTRAQQSLRKSCINTWYRELEHDPAPLSWSPQDFYQAAHVPDKQTFDPKLAFLQVPQLEATLYPFQRRAVHWLLQREGAKWPPTSGDGPPQIQQDISRNTSELSVSFAQVKDADGQAFYMSSLLGVATRDITPFVTAQNVRGGILAEEMGLGKTVEVISLILLHKRPECPTMVLDPYLGKELLTTPATLIVTPATLLDQWLSELDRHAPALSVMYYPGFKKATKTRDEEELVLEMARHDVVITTYDVLRAEVWLTTDEPSRAMRNAKRYERPKCPLVQLSWWRVCIDEAQMVENWTSNAAVVARLLPRINAWAITGTPVKDDVKKDLRGLLNFLRYEPFASDAKTWNDLTTFDKESFRKLFNLISMRHTKSLVRSEIALPPQRRHVITMPFSAVEEQHYQTLFEELARDCGLDSQGNPLVDNWDPEDSSVLSAMRMALDRLRQTALHPEVGNRNRRALGQKVAPMRTVAEVLDAMLEQSESAIRTDQRALLSSKLTRGQVLAGRKQVKDAQALWEEIRQKSTEMVQECRKQLDFELTEAKKRAREAAQTQDQDEAHSLEDDDDDDVISPGVGDARRRLRSALEIQHRAVFFCANAYFTIKSNEELTRPDSEEYRALDKLETEHYDGAKEIRKEILQETSGKAKKLMDQLETKAKEQLFAEMPEIQIDSPSGIESRRIVEALEQLGAALNQQANLLDDWRNHVISLLLKDLVDEDKDETTGQEYEDSTKVQDEIDAYLKALRAAVADRNAAISGQKSFLVEHETRVALGMALDNEGPAPEKLRELLKIREAISPGFEETDTLTSLRGIVAELRALSVKLRHDSAAGSTRAATELTIVSKLLKVAQSQQTDQLKAVVKVEQEVDRFNDTLNARLDFYRQLQTLSDTVAEFEGSTDDKALAAVLKQEENLHTKVATAEAKHRYLLHLKEADNRSEEQRMCVICQTTFSVGVLTVCGHQFCKECITLWFKAHRNCPVCKRALNHSNLHDITLKPQELKVHSEAHHGGGSSSEGQQHPSSSSPTTKKISTIYTEFNPEKLAEIKNIDLEGPCFTTKVDTLIRHLLWLRESDPGAKSIVFSQYKDFLDVLALAFKRYRIGFAAFEGHGVTQFREDPGTEVFLLHARAHSSGLNLVNASHVFLCEPLLNTALELQAIARVDRIGQQHETTVWLYIVDGTVEESIYNLSVQRRLEHMGRKNLLTLGEDAKGKGKSIESTPELLDASLDAANSMELQQAQLSKLMGKDGVVGEVVDMKDLWTCLFGHVAREGSSGAGQADGERFLIDNPVTRGFLAAEAAEERMRDIADRTASASGGSRS
ncbi:putative ATP-dependent helicase IRC20 [Rhypophila decipiens]|uniref:ATP-dependent helicase IRC20 n=1 Tax=Rhypophila decipiens TaxID=261697 RepID=A0AAN6YKM1_9PEZI|nr:putative ATP-dependent helicase IRC20 [Rhypophila decipiens]